MWEGRFAIFTSTRQIGQGWKEDIGFQSHGEVALKSVVSLLHILKPKEMGEPLPHLGRPDLPPLEAKILSASSHGPTMKRGHTIEIFSAGCPLCTYVSDVIEVGRCRGCTQIVLDVNQATEEVEGKMREYGVHAVPTIVIDGEIKITGIPPFPWVCDEDFYRRLREDYPLRDTGRAPT
jgi:hypothetical protein